MKIQLVVDVDSVEEALEVLQGLNLGKSTAHNGAQPSKTSQPVADTCPIHNKKAASKKGGWYCPVKLQDGSYCQWRA